MIDSIIYKFFKKCYSKFKNCLFKEDYSKVQDVFSRNCDLLFKMSREYPSVINTGYRHIEVAIELIKKNNLENLTIIDVGGATGDVALMFSKSFPYATIHSFEPIFKSFSKLQEKAKDNQNIQPHHFALGAKKDNFKINVAERITSSSLFEINTEIGDSFFSENLKLNRHEEINVRVLDDELGNDSEVSLIKLDVQGFELEVLKGAVNTLKKTHFILTEVMNHDFYKGAPLYFEIDHFLRENNFELFDIIPSIRREGKLMEWDIIYKNTDFK
jgi:FkbM family methyltransferase